MSDGTRTRDRLDHNQELYQLSYTHRVRESVRAQPAPDAPARIRTWDLRLRRPLLYPAELQGPGAGLDTGPVHRTAPGRALLPLAGRLHPQLHPVRVAKDEKPAVPLGRDARRGSPAG